ncbi:hypothetical protein [Cerasicoccus maritimus]|uniref:hypothetical protein n=1 Tax=Cerasicoccus maritimus TaxID=490089 RepID=UPI002852761F|nr:hypothetical protein [Cerasicoccus maritimus]
MGKENPAFGAFFRDFAALDDLGLFGKAGLGLREVVFKQEDLEGRGQRPRWPVSSSFGAMLDG